MKGMQERKTERSKQKKERERKCYRAVLTQQRHEDLSTAQQNYDNAVSVGLSSLVLMTMAAMSQI